MTYARHVTVTTVVEVTNVSPHGLWMLLDDQDVFLSYDQFPWFREAPIGKVVQVELPSPGHLYWPELDIDLEVDCVLHPVRYPLVSRVHEAKEEYSPDEHSDEWAWKGFDFEVIERLCEKGYILDPRGKSKSVVLTGKGLARSRELSEELFGNKG